MAKLRQAMDQTQDVQATVDMAREIEKLRAENARLRESRTPGLSCKVTVARKPGTHNPQDKGSDGGAISVYGLGKWPVTLYAGQWNRLLDFVPSLKKFMAEHSSELSVKE